MSESLVTIFDTVIGIISKFKVKPVEHRDECYITFKAKDDKQFNAIKMALQDELVNHIRIRRCQNKCTVNFVQ